MNEIEDIKMKKRIGLVVIGLIGLPLGVFSQEYVKTDKTDVLIVKNPFGAAASIMAQGLTENLDKLFHWALEETW